MLVFPVFCAESASKKHFLFSWIKYKFFRNQEKNKRFCMLPIGRVIARLSIFMFDGGLVKEEIQ